jgi:hypothetical protein
LIEEVGFEAVYMTGFGTSAALVGLSDVSLLSASKMADNARRIVEAAARSALWPYRRLMFELAAADRDQD